MVTKTKMAFLARVLGAPALLALLLLRTGPEVVTAARVGSRAEARPNAEQPRRISRPDSRQVLGVAPSGSRPLPGTAHNSAQRPIERSEIFPGGAQTTIIAAPPAPLPEPTNELVFWMAPGADARDVARDYRLELNHPLTGEMRAWTFRAATPEAAARVRELAAADPRVLGAFLDVRVERHHFDSFTPNDPLTPFQNTTLPGQWHLIDANLAGAWNFNITGKGVNLSIVDDCLEFTHPDLAANFNAADSYNFSGNPLSYGPDTSKDGTVNEDGHGTCVAGVAAAVGGNGIGVTGAAPQAKIAVQRLDFSAGITVSQLANAVGYHSTSPTNPLNVKNHSYGSIYSYDQSTAESTAVTNSTASGTIHVYAAGNGYGTVTADSNKLMPQNSPEVITVAAFGSDGQRASYSSFGTNVFVTAPSSTSNAGGYWITTTDRVGTPGFNDASDPLPDLDYTSLFGGTSSAAPLVTGIIGLAKQVQPNLTARWAQHALARSSDFVHPGDLSFLGDGDGVTAGSAWHTNAAGFKFDPKYGFGRINAGNFVAEVLKYKGVTTLDTETVSVSGLSDAIPDNPSTPPLELTKTFTMSKTTPLESVVVGLRITHPRRGQLEARLISPQGTNCRLMIRENGDYGFPPDNGAFPDPGWAAGGLSEWPFLTNMFWGENPQGTWTLQIRDLTTGQTGTLNSFTVTTRMGTPIPDDVAPTVVSINRANPTPTAAIPLVYTVKFSKFVKNVDTTDFALTTTGSIVGASVLAVTGSIDTYTVTVDPGVGAGTVRLDLIDNDSIIDGAGNPLGGAGLVNGDFKTGQTYTFTGTVGDGLVGADIDTQTSTTTISAHWEGFVGAGSGVAGYRWAIGTTPGGTDVQPFTDVGLMTLASTSMMNQTLSLTVATTYYVSVEARDGLGATTVVTSDGVQIVAADPSIPAPATNMIAFSASTTSVQLFWTAAPTAGVAGYRLWYKPSAQPWTQASLKDSLTGTTTIVTGLTTGTPYDFLLRALLPTGNESPGLFASGTPSAAITINGSGSYPDVQNAIDNANPGDIVTVQAGTYAVNLTLKAGVTLSGVAPHLTILTASNPSAPVITATGTTPLATAMLLTTTNGTFGVDGKNATLLLQNVIVHHNSSGGVVSANPSDLRVVNCTLAHNGGVGLDANGTTIVRNVIATGNGTIGIKAPAAALVTFSDSYANGTTSFSGGFPLGSDYTTAATFTDEAGNDYTETLDSFSIDSGDPIDGFALEPDYNGGRINLGAFGNTPFAATSPIPPAAPPRGGGGGGGGCGLTGWEGVLLVALLRRGLRKGRP